MRDDIMQKLSSRGSGKKADLKAVSEAIGTVLLLGISITLTGGIALWTSQIEEGDEALIVDLWAYIRGDDLVLIHRGGDRLEGVTTLITLLDSSNVQISSDDYETLSADTDGSWTTGEELTMDVSGIPDEFQILVTAVKNTGVTTVILKNSLVRSSSISAFADLAITRVTIMNSDSVPVTRINDDGTYIFFVEIMNFGSDMSSPHFSVSGDNTLNNLRLFDETDELEFSGIVAVHYTNGGTTTLYPGNGGFGRLLNGDTIEVYFTWGRTTMDPRTLGLHTLNVKIIPFLEGERDYSNNYVKREYKVDKLLKPIPFFGPDPGIYSVTFSDDAPNSGDVVIVTVIVQNSGDQPIRAEDGVSLVVSLWKPEIHQSVSTVSYDWRGDFAGHEGDWRGTVDHIPLFYDDEFPTCVVPNIALLTGAYFFFYFELEARVDVPGGMQWIYAAIDVYDEPDHQEGIPIINGDSTNDNFALSSIQVLPRILLVDDDDVATGSDDDMTSSVLESLVGSGIKIDTLFQTDRIMDNGVERDGPAFSYEQDGISTASMEDFDVVIWVTGYVADPLTNNISDPGGGNIQEMMKFMDDNGYLMIVGSRPFGGLASHFGSGNTFPVPALPPAEEPYAENASVFLYNYLGIKKVDTGIDMPGGEGAHFVGSDTDEGGLTPGANYSITLREGPDNDPEMDLFTIRSEFDPVSFGFETPVGVLSTEADLLTLPPRYSVVRSNSTPDANQSNSQYRSVSISFDIKDIRYLNEKIDLIATVLKWFDWQINVGRDLAITKMEMSIITEVIDGGTTVWEPIPVTNDNLPKYLDTILIEATVRNNGPSVDGSSVIFYVKGPDGVELPITPGIPDPRTEEREIYGNPYDVPSIPGAGGEEEIFKLWLAVGVGSYEFRVVVDPYQLVSEISEENNDISYSTSTITSFVTQNNVLIVDDDSSDDNFDWGGETQGMKGTRVIDYSSRGGEPSELINTSLTMMDIDHEVHIVRNSFNASEGWTYDSGLSIIDLKRYNSIIWITGDTGDRAGPVKRETLTDNDIRSISYYLDGNYPEADYLPVTHNENMMFIGQGLIPELTTYGDEMVTASMSVDEFIMEYLGIATSDPLEGTARLAYGPPYGEFLEDIFVGIQYLTDDFDMRFDHSSITADPGIDADMQTFTPGLYTIDDSTRTIRMISGQYSYHDEVVSNHFRTLTHSWQIGASDHDLLETTLNEIMFLCMHWFETPSEKPELVGRNTKIFFENDHPVIGNSYLVVVEIINLGGAPGGGTVRFRDGGTLVNSINVYLDPDQSTILETIWTPLYAGTREFTVSIDHFNDYDEIFDTMNNVPRQRRTIYFFWDNLESGTDNWDHDATIMLLNGESPVDFMDPLIPDVDTNVISEWDDTLSVGMETTDNESHSAPYSFYLKEAQGVTRSNANVLLSIVIDDSASMTGRYASDGVTNWLESAKDAAKILLDQLSNDSVVISIWDFAGNLERRFSGPDDDISYSSSSVATSIKRLPVRLGDDHGGIDGRQLIRNEIDSMSNPSGTTILWDAIGGAYEDISYYSSYYPDLNPTVIVLSDGTDVQASDRGTLGYQKLEAGSDAWAPWDDMADGTQSYDNGHFGKYTLDWSDPAGTTEWVWALQHGGAIDRTRIGLLYSDIPIYTIGLGVEGHDPPYEPVRTTRPAEYTLDTTYAVCTGSGCQESGTLEYNLWRIANTSKAQYFHAPSADDLADVFKTLGQLIADQGSMTRSSLEMTRADADPEEDNSNKTAVTRTVSILGSSQAMVSLWHKFDFVGGSNGAYMEVGYRDPDVDSNGNGIGNDDWDWKYIIPSKGHYNDNLYLSVERKDSFDNDIVWGWSGTSGNGRFTWDYVEVDLLDHVPEDYRGMVKVRFCYVQYGGGTGNGWWIDDVRISVSRTESTAVGVFNPDMWTYLTGSEFSGNTHSGAHSWFAGDMKNKDGDLLDGVDNSLYTRSIDLTNAKSATLSAYFKFNIDKEAGMPPDCLRVEVSTDGGLTWISLNMGVRAAWGVSGSEPDDGDGFEDKRSYTGIDEGGGWVNANTMTRLTTDLSGFLGNTIRIRFRIVTDVETDHFESDSEPKGVYIDDIVVYGQSLESTRSSNDDIIPFMMEGPSNEMKDVPVFEGSSGYVGSSKEDISPSGAEGSFDELNGIHHDMTNETMAGGTSISLVVLFALILTMISIKNLIRKRKGKGTERMQEVVE